MTPGLIILALMLTFVLTAPAHSLTFSDGYHESWAQENGPQFLLPWSAQDLATVRRALDKLEDEHLKDKAGIDDYLMGRRARILENLDTYSFIVLGENGAVFRWLSLPQLTLVGFAVSRDRYCRAEDQDVDELDFLKAGVECYVRNTAAIELFGRISSVRHDTPGGNQ